MRKVVTCSALVSLLLLAHSAARAALTHRWSFNESTGTNLANSVGLTPASVAVLAGAGGYALTNGAVRLDGGTRASADYVTIPGTVFDGVTNSTIELWAEAHSFPNWGRIIELTEGDAVPNPTTNNFRLSWSIGIVGNQQRFGWRPYAAVDSALNTPTDTVNHYAIVFSATGGPGGQSLVTWYRDGVLVTNQVAGTYTLAAFSALVNRTVWLARSPFTGDATANASYHEMRIYNHALTPAEIVSSYAAGPDYLTPAAVVSVVTNGLVGALTVSWTPSTNGSGSLVVLNAAQAPANHPVNGFTYTASASFGSGANLGASNFVVYAGPGSNVVVSNLVPGVRYYATVYAYSGSGATTIYNHLNAPTASEVVFAIAQSVSLQVPSEILLGGTGQATVLANFGSGITNDVTSGAAYSSSATNIIAVSAGGVLLARGSGTATITATYQGKQDSRLVTVINPLTQHLKHRYLFATDAADFIGTAHGTMQGGATVAGGQLQLNGTSAYVDLPAGILNGLEAITLEAWVSNSVTATWSRIFDFGSGQTVNMFLTPRADGGAGPIRFAITTTGGGANEQRVNGTSALPAATVKHVVVTLSGNVAILYVDGLAVGTNNAMTLNPSSLGNTTQNYLGKSQYPDPYFGGAMDEFRIYDVSLPPGLVQSNFLAGPNGLPALPPQVANDVATLNPGAKALLAVLANDTGPAGVPSTLEVVTPPSNGTAVVKPDGRILYTHNGNATTADLFTYRVQNSLGQTSAVATVSLTITNALRLPAPTLALPSTPPVVGYQFVDAFPGLFFEDAVAVSTPPGVTNKIFVAERRGRISYVPDINSASPQRVVFLDIVSQVSFDDTTEGERGLLGMAFHPGFSTNGHFYVYYLAPGSPYIDRVSRFTADPVTLTVNTNTQLKLFDVVDQDFNHNGGDLHFGNDGYLYVGMGDEGQQYNIRLNSQRIDKDLFSALLRIDVDKRPGNLEPRPSANTTTIYTNGSGQAFYSIPADNPFVNATTFLGSPINTNTLRAEMFAVGFRHIWRFSIDKPTGEIWVGDVGQDRYEEINVVTNGGNYGWAYLEGLFNTVSLYNGQPTLLSNPPPSFVHSPPLYPYPHTTVAGGDPQFKGNSVTGGVVYRGSRIPELTGAYIFGDFESTHVWALWRTNGTVSVQRLGSTIAPAGFGLDPGNGDILVANYVMNRIERLVRVDTGDATFPQKLSDTGAFADLADLAPNPGLVSYEPIVSFWSDHAIKRRWFGIPDLTNTVTHVTDGNWSLPSGMVWVKHFDMETTRGNPATKKRLETRFLVKNDAGMYGVSYAWNGAGDEASLVADGGTNFNLTITNGLTILTQQWGVPSRSECLVCHTEVGGRALSFNTRQLNQSASMNGQTGNQLALLSAAGYFANPVAAPQALPAFSRANDAAVSLEHRARSYFSVNCVQCHQTGGAGPATWDARAWLSLDETMLIHGTPYNNGGNPTNQLVIPGDPAHSVVLQRIRGNGFSRMPPLASMVIDEAATNLLHAWIGIELTNRVSFASWQLTYFGSTNVPNALAIADPDQDGANNYYEYLTQTSPTNAVPPPWTISIDENAGTVGVSFQRIANLGFLVETSTDFTNWSLWNVPANVLWFSASNFVNTVTGPLGGETNRFYRVQIYEP